MQIIRFQGIDVSPDPSGINITEISPISRVSQYFKAQLFSTIYAEDDLPNLDLPAVTELRLGTGGLSNGVPLGVSGLEENLIAPITSGYSPENTYHDMTTRMIDNPSVPVMHFSLMLEEDELENVSISEMGLFTEDGRLFSKKTFLPFTKPAGEAMLITWRLPVL